MSTAVVSTPAAQGRPFLFDDESEVQVRPVLGKKPTQADITQAVQSTIKNQQSSIPGITPASRLAIRPTPEMASTGIPALDALIGGLARGCITELCGPASSGRTSVMLATLAAATRRGEYCAVIDASDSLDPQSLADSGVDLDRLLWVRCNDNSPQKQRGPEKKRSQKEGCPISRAGLAREVGIFEQVAFNFDRPKSCASEHRLEQVLRATDLLLESGGFGLIILDFADLPPQAARRIPLTTWFRFRRAVEHKPTILLAIEQQPIAGSCSSLMLQLGVPSTQYPVPSASDDGADALPSDRKDQSRSHTQLMTELRITAELIRSRLDRKPSCSAMFEAKTAWAG